MRLGFDVTALLVPHSGIGTYTTNLLDHLGHCADLEIIPLSHRPWPPEPPTAAGRGAPRPWLNKTVWMQAVLPRQLGRLGLDVCHFTNNVAPIWGTRPTVLTIHDMTLWLYPEYHGRRRLLAMRPVIPLAARRAAAIITVSESARRDIVSILKVPADKVHVIHEAPAPHFRVLASRSRLELVRKHHVLPERFILTVGTIEPRKNLVRLLEAFARLRRSSRPDHGLVLVGQRGWRDEAVFAAVERLDLGDAVRFLGYVSPDTLVALYNLAEVAAFPSLYEGFGLPAVEAMACGAPLVTSARGSLAEVTGDAAEFVEPTDVDSIAAGLERVLSDEAHRAELRAKGLARAAGFSWDRAARETRAVYARAVGESRARLAPSRA